MERILQIAAIAVLTCAACLLVRSRAAELSLMISVAGLILVLTAAVHFFSPVVEVFRSLQKLSDLSDAVGGPLLKAAGVALVTQITCGICEDAGEKSLGQAVQIAGHFLSLYAGLPLLTAVIDLLEDTIG